MGNTCHRSGKKNTIIHMNFVRRMKVELQVGMAPVVEIILLYLHLGLSSADWPREDWRPPTRLARPPSALTSTPSLLLRPSLMAPSPSLLLLRPGELTSITGAKPDPLFVRCFGVGRRLARRLVITLAGRDCRWAMGLSSLEVLSSSSSGITNRRPETGVPTESRDVEPGVERRGAFVRTGVEGDCIGLAKERRLACWAGVVDAGRAGCGASTVGVLRGLRTGIAEWLDTLLSVLVGTGGSLR